MEKSKVLAIGCGGTGNKLLDEFLNLDRRYTGIFMNLNLSEMEGLKHFDRERRCFYIPNADGTGKDKSVGEKYIKEDASKFAEMIKKYIVQTYVLMYCSGNGGTGGTAVVLFSKMIKKLCPEKSINIVATVPRMEESDIDFDNMITFWNDLIDLKEKGIIDSIQLIDNNKSQSYKEINTKAMKEVDESFNIASGELDSSDSRRVHTARGYKVVLKLDHSIRHVKDAIDKSIKESMFFMPDNFDCDVMVGNINTEYFKTQDIQNEFSAYSFTKFNQNEFDESYIALGGCEMPNEAIGLVMEALKELQNKKSKRVKTKDLIIESTSQNRKNEEVKTNETKSKLTNRDLEAMFEDDSFWN